jgi:uracil-DNA glycosylase family 4
MHPWFAEGKFNPDIVIMGEEPGYHDPDPDGNRIGKPFEQSRKDIREVANEDSGTLKQVRPLFEVLYDNDIATYWTEMTKCNPIGNNDNLDGQDECCGLSEDVERSYLRDELEELEPEIVVTLGKPASKNLLELYNHKLSDFADSTMSGEPLSGFHTRSNHTARFEIATAFHPTYLFDNSEFQSRKSDIKTQQNQNGVKKPYYGQYGDDLLRWFKKATQS